MSMHLQERCRLVESDVTVHTQPQYAQVNWPILFQPLGHTGALSFCVHWLAFESNIALCHSQRSNERVAKMLLAGGRIIHRQPTPFIKLHEPASIDQRRLIHSSLGE